VGTFQIPVDSSQETSGGGQYLRQNEETKQDG